MHEYLFIYLFVTKIKNPFITTGHNKLSLCKWCAMLNDNKSRCKDCLSQVQETRPIMKGREELTVFGYYREEYINKQKVSYPTVLMKISQKYLEETEVKHFFKHIQYKRKHHGDYRITSWDWSCNNSMEIIRKSPKFKSVPELFGNHGEILTFGSKILCGGHGKKHIWTVKVVKNGNGDFAGDSFGVGIIKMERSRIYERNSEVLLCGDGRLCDKRDISIHNGMVHKGGLKSGDIVTIELDLSNTDFTGGIAKVSFGVNSNWYGIVRKIKMDMGKRRRAGLFMLCAKFIAPGVTVQIVNFDTICA